MRSRRVARLRLQPTESARRHASTLSVREETHGAVDGQDARDGRGEVHERPSQKPRRSTESLEKAAREDPVVKEFTRLLKAEVVEVRALDAEDAHEE